MPVLDGAPGAPTAYGLGLRGLEDERNLLGPPEPAFPVVTVDFVEHDRPVADEVMLDGDRFEKLLVTGHVLRASRDARTASLTGPPIESADRIHPFLAPLAGLHNRWLGREVFHAGVFAAAARAWVVVGVREAGKSSLLACLASRGHTVLADDIAVLDETTVYSGPRCIDLRGPVPGVTPDQPSVRGGARARLFVPPPPPSLPLGGWLFPRWGDEVRLTRVPPQQLIGMLGRARRRNLVPSYPPPDPAALLELVGHPAWILERPRDWAYADETLSAVMDTATTGLLRASSSSS